MKKLHCPRLESGWVISAVIEDAVFHHKVLVVACLFGGNTCGRVVHEHGLGEVRNLHFREEKSGGY